MASGDRKIPDEFPKELIQRLATILNQRTKIDPGYNYEQFALDLAKELKTEFGERIKRRNKGAK